LPAVEPDVEELLDDDEELLDDDDEDDELLAAAAGSFFTPLDDELPADSPADALDRLSVR
jgi:hypothetical protein